jgi:hypothetical protein
MSPSMKVIHHDCPILMLSMGPCDSFDETPFFQISQSGKAVAVWYAHGGEPVTVYTLPPTTPTH